jgi:release factor glutamine methyltransferase
MIETRASSSAGRVGDRLDLRRQAGVPGPIGRSPRQNRQVPVTDALFDAVAGRLAAAGCVAAAGEAAELLAAAPDEEALASWLRRREQGEPLAWITRTVRFCGRPLHAAPGVYVPRIQTEELARRAAALLPPGGRAVDLCTGVGAVAAHLHAEVPTASVVGIDIDRRAAACARRNGVPTVVADMAEPVAGAGAFDLVTAVAPYVPTGSLRFLPADVQRYEPRLALDGGADGLDLVRRTVTAAGRLLRPGGWLLLEVGGGQDEVLAPLVDGAFDRVTSWRDDDGDLRGTAMRRVRSGEPDDH